MARPREFDTDSALDSAMDMFWKKGYDATSLDDLCEETGLSRSSLYAAFGSKRGLLLQTIDRYVARRIPDLTELLDQHKSVRQACAALARHFIDDIVEGPGRIGCFLGNCAAGLPREDRVAAKHVRDALHVTEKTFYEALASAQAAGELRRDADVAALARFLTTGFQGLRLVGKVNPDRDYLEDVAATMLRCLE